MMKTAIICSKKDPASENIRKALDSHDFINGKLKINENEVSLYTIGGSLINDENLDKKIDADVFIFASKHVSKENTPSFTAHPIGNWGRADFGGKERVLCPSSSFLLKNIFLKLSKNAKGANYAVTLESTHHGPLIDKPALFIEIGSTEKEWNDPDNGRIISDTIINAIKKHNGNDYNENDYNGDNWISSILLGGTHYSHAGNKIILRTNYAIGHICPKYALEYLDEEMLMQAINKTIPKPKIVLVDWKGLGRSKQKIIGLLEKLNIPYKRTEHVK